MIIGDFNGVGKYGFGRRNYRENLVIDFYRRNNLMITNTWIKKRK